MSAIGRKVGIGRLLSLLLLPCMSFYAARIISSIFLTETGESFVKNCHEDAIIASSARISYTGNALIDNRMCILVAFMEAGLDKGNAYYFLEFYANFGPSAVIPYLEMRRAGFRTPVVLVSMLTLGFFYQLFTGAVILPIWWIIHLLSSGLNTVSLHPHYVEGTLIGYLLCYLIVSVLLCANQATIINAIWQVFPASIVLVQSLYLGYQHYANGDAPECSHDLLQLVHITNFCWSSIAHWYTLFQVFKSTAPFISLKHAYYPTFSPDSVSPLSSLSQRFLKWDILFISGTTLFAGLWYLRDARQRFLASIWFVLGSVAFGMGAGLSGIWMWREKVLEEDRRTLAQRSKDD